jgi:NCAIR mutase (PurE)-related protein
MSADEINLDFGREGRIGMEEAVFCAGKTDAQLIAILDQARDRGAAFLLTRLSPEQLGVLPDRHRGRIDYCETSRTGVFGGLRPLTGPARVAIVAAGSSDARVAREAERTLRYHGQGSVLILDVGVAGLHRLTQRLPEIRAYPIVIVAAGMDAALPSVLGGLVGSALIAVPTSVGYGVAEGGRTALNAILASCAPGVVTVNIDNGYGAACAALRMLQAFSQLPAAT